MSRPGLIVAATDLSEHARPALVRGLAHARAIGAPLVVCHVLVDVFLHHPLIPDPQNNELVLGATVMRRAAERVTAQVAEVLGVSPDEVRIAVETGAPAEEIVRLAEKEDASLVVVGAKPRVGAERVLGHVAERVVRYAHGPVLVARGGPATGKALVATDFTEGSIPAMRVAGDLVRTMGTHVTLLHVMKLPSSALPSAFMPLGDTWMPPSKAAIEELAKLGLRTLEGLAKQYGLQSFEQREGDPADVILERAAALGIDLVITGSRGRRGLARLVLGSVAEKVVRSSHCSVLIARDRS
jgi:nucleotide-binding universal stress UspA family protein